MYMLLHPDRNDSGIDSDGIEAEDAPARQLGGEGSDVSSSDGEDESFLWREKIMKNYRVIVKENCIVWTKREEQAREDPVVSSSPEPNSIVEIELTTSDEDDDGSVMEFVIPMQPSRYQRVPTSSSKRIVQTPTSLLWSVFCCGRQ